ncbi:hypothetical protein [Lysobacter enzymogenes]|uniref:hypothetical protein n=1 Tax=Lysobacter enzymogenes TaxID=69 RepID=UPI001A9706F2|nr:hypothetical protein [Lysobacter enzymogenes]QQP95851.1 hypothetical protein JHW38_21955 [Lysobacter enzymogenes]
MRDGFGRGRERRCAASSPAAREPMPAPADAVGRGCVFARASISLGKKPRRRCAPARRRVRAPPQRERARAAAAPSRVRAFAAAGDRPRWRMPAPPSRRNLARRRADAVARRARPPLSRSVSRARRRRAARAFRQTRDIRREPPPRRSRVALERARTRRRIPPPARAASDARAANAPADAVARIRRRRAPTRSALASDRPTVADGGKKFAHFRAFGLVRRENGGVGGKEFFLPVQVVAHAFAASANARAHRSAREKEKRERAETRATLGFQRCDGNSFARCARCARVRPRRARSRRPRRSGRRGEEKIAGVVDSRKKRD